MDLLLDAATKGRERRQDITQNAKCHETNWCLARHRKCCCEGEVIVQGDEGPVREVAQVVDCHGVTVGHEEREEEEERQEVESDEEKTLKERCACPWMGG